jgi:energy-coupling factor transporter transmembrane protein EcfT
MKCSAKVTTTRNAKRKKLFHNLVDVHPLIRVSALLVFIAGLAFARPLFLAGSAGLLLLLYTVSGFPGLARLLQMTLRLRWLLLAILMVYGWWTPGNDLLPLMGAWSPSSEGIITGLLRIFSLLLIVAAVHLLLQLTSRSELLPAIMQAIRPVTTEAARARLAVRILLTLEAVTKVQPLVSEALKQRPLKDYRLETLGLAARALYQSVLDRAEQSAGEVIDVPTPGMPPFWQWLIPVGLSAAVYLSI